MLQNTLPLGVSLSQCFIWMEAIAKQLPHPQNEIAIKFFRDLVSSVGQTEVTVNVPIDHILCQACDTLRRMERHREVQVIEELIKELKNGKHRHIIGQLNLNGESITILDNQYENIRKAITLQS